MYFRSEEKIQGLSLKCSAWKGFVLIPSPYLQSWWIRIWISNLVFISISPFLRDRVKLGSKGGEGALFLSLKEAYIPNLSLILCLAWKPNFCFQFLTSRGIGLSAVVRLGMGQFLNLREAYIQNLLFCLGVVGKSGGPHLFQLYQGRCHTFFWCL